MSNSYDFGDIPDLWLKQELFVITKILAKSTYYSSTEPVHAIYSEFLAAPILPTEGTFFIDNVMARISEIIKKLNILNLIYGLEFGDPEMQRTSMVFFVSKDSARNYKITLMKEIRVREGRGEVRRESEDILINGKLIFDIDNREVKYGEEKPLGLDPSSDYGRFLAILMGNLNNRVTYTQICDAIGRDYKVEDIDPEKDPSIKREIQQVKKDLLVRLKKAGIPKSILSELIVPRDGYKMNKIK